MLVQCNKIKKCKDKFCPHAKPHEPVHYPEEEVTICTEEGKCGWSSNEKLVKCIEVK